VPAGGNSASLAGGASLGYELGEVHSTPRGAVSAQVQRKLTTILAADAEGYSRAMDADEVAAIGALQSARGVFSRLIERRHGRIANTAGDGLIAEFPSVVEAVQCAIEVQNELGRGPVPGGALRFRIGIHLGDVIVDGDDLLGDGVNLAARLQAMAEPGGVLISQQVYDQVYKKLSVAFEYLGQKRPKNFNDDVAVYRVFAGKDVRPDSKGREAAPDARKAHQRRTPERASPASADLRQRVVRHAVLLGGIWVMLLAANLVTGATFWAQWPGLAMAAFVALEACPLVAKGWFTLHCARAVVIIAALALINIFTWSGYPWAVWPAGALIVAELARRLWSRPA
jgi:adenylate cyclase